MKDAGSAVGDDSLARQLLCIQIINKQGESYIYHKTCGKSLTRRVNNVVVRGLAVQPAGCHYVYIGESVAGN